MRARTGALNRISVLEEPFAPTPVVKLSGDYCDNEIWIKRDDLLPFSFGGNKARKAQCFYHDIMRQQPDVVMTYGSNSSNHCRIIANMAASMGIPCHIISTDHEVQGKDGRKLFNRVLVEDFGATLEIVPVERVHDTIENRMEAFRKEGRTPYFIQGGGHGDVGTAAYYHAFCEILQQEEALGTAFSHIFLASGTGATQGGLVCGLEAARHGLAGSEHGSCSPAGGQENRSAAADGFSLPDPGEKKAGILPAIVGISIARRNPRGRDVVRESIVSFLSHTNGCSVDWFREEDLIFDDSYILGGYGEYNADVEAQIRKMMVCDGIPMDTTYVGKAFTGMLHYLQDHEIHGQKILFLHTGGTPLFFDRL